MAQLSGAERKTLPAKAFAEPDKRKYPIENEAHAKNVLSRVSQSGTPAEKAKVKDALKKKYHRLAKNEERSLDDTPADTHRFIRLRSASGGMAMAGRPKKSSDAGRSRTRSLAGRKPLTDLVAVVAGATRGAGRGIARALGEAGATIYCTGRSVHGNRSPYNRPETVDETVEMICSAGGSAIGVRVDHTVEREVEEFFGRVVRERSRLDILVNSIAGEDPLMAQWCSFWKTDLKDAEAALRQSFVSHIITAKHAAGYMIRNRSGLIVEVTENDVLSAGGNPITQAVKLALKGLALNMAAELRPYGVSAVAITPGFLRSETMLERFCVTEETWRDGAKKDKNFLESESPLFIGRAVAALAGDPAILERSGQLLSSWELGREYRLTDADGRRPDWGASKIDFSRHPAELLQLLRTGSEIQLRWLSELTRKTQHFLGQLPH